MMIASVCWNNILRLRWGLQTAVHNMLCVAAIWTSVPRCRWRNGKENYWFPQIAGLCQLPKQQVAPEEGLDVCIVQTHCWTLPKETQSGATCFSFAQIIISFTCLWNMLAHEILDLERSSLSSTCVTRFLAFFPYMVTNWWRVVYCSWYYFDCWHALSCLFLSMASTLILLAECRQMLPKRGLLYHVLCCFSCSTLYIAKRPC